MSNKRIVPVFRFYDSINEAYINEATCNEGKDCFWEYIDGLDGYLEISFDNGVTFRTMEEMKTALKVYDNWKNNVETIRENYEQ